MSSRKARTRKKTGAIDPHEIATICAWCGRKIAEDSEIFSLGAKVKSGIDTQKQGGRVVSMFLAKSGKTVNAIVPTDTSQARKDGNDVLFALCSTSCGDALKQTLQEELGTFERFQ